jgi:hypothetical protein
MPVTDDARHELHTDLTNTIGRSSAATLMELLPPVGWDDLATRQDLHQQTTLLRRDLEHLRASTKKDLDHHTAVHRAELHGAFNQLRSEMAGMRMEMQSEFAQMRSDMQAGLADVRSYVDRGLREQTRVFVVAVAALLTGVGSSVVAAVATFVG